MRSRLFNYSSFKTFFLFLRASGRRSFYLRAALSAASLPTRILLAILPKYRELRRAARATFREAQARPDLSQSIALARKASSSRASGNGLDAIDSAAPVRALVRAASGGQVGAPLDIQASEDGLFRPSCNDLPGMFDALCAMVRGGSLIMLKLYAGFNEHVVASYSSDARFCSAGKDRETAWMLFREHLENELLNLDGMTLECELGILLGEPLPAEMKVRTVRGAEADGGRLMLCCETSYSPEDGGADILCLLAGAAAGNAPAMNALGILQAVHPDSGTGRAPADWFEMAVGLGYAPAMMNLASMLSAGKGFDRERVIHLLARSYLAGVYMSAFLMGRLFLPFYGWESGPSPALVRLMERTASSESLSARYLAYQYFHGAVSGGPDYGKAMRYNLMLTSKEDPSPEHQFLVGYMYLKGLGVSPDKGEALSWFGKAAGNPRCTGSLADLALTYAADLAGRRLPPAETERTRRSRTLAYLLRHDPSYAFPPEGWRGLDDLRPHGFSPEEIRDIVASDPKGRFELDAEGGRVRARGAHSVPVEPGWETDRVPDVLFHGTTFRALPAILEEGLDRRGRSAVCLTDDRIAAIRSGMRHGDPVVIRVDAGRMSEDGARFRKGGDHDWYTRAVPEEYLSAD